MHRNKKPYGRLDPTGPGIEESRLRTGGRRAHSVRSLRKILAGRNRIDAVGSRRYSLLRMNGEHRLSASASASASGGVSRRANGQHASGSRASGQTSRNVLVVEDCNHIRFIIKQCLQRVHPELNVVEATDGMNALEILAERTAFDVFIFDVVMPRLDGAKLAQMLSESDRHKDIPVLLLSGIESEKLEPTLDLSNVKGYVQKPIGPLAVVRRIEKILEKEGKGLPNPGNPLPRRASHRAAPSSGRSSG